MKISAHINVNRGESYGFPYQEAIQSLLWCDEVVVGCDPRFADGTEKAILALEKRHKNVHAYIHEFDWDHPNPHGMMKQQMRRQCTGEWIVELDPNEYFPQESIGLAQEKLTNAPKSVYLIDVQSFYLFNGYWIHRDMPKSRPLMSRNTSRICHSLDTPNFNGRWGASYITDKNIGYSASMSLPIRLWNFEWYSLPQRWMQKQYWHYIEGRMKDTYSTVAHYQQNLDREEVDFWDIPVKLPIDHYIPAIRTEMFPRFMNHDGLPHNRLKRFHGKLPSGMIPWCQQQETVKMRRWKLWLSRGLLW